MADDTLPISERIAERVVEVDLRWRPIQTAPHGELLLVCEPGCGYALCKHFCGAWRDPDGSIMRPTHWMPLPAWPRGPLRQKRTTDPIMLAWFCGECMNSSEFATRGIVPREGACECCGRTENGKVWELGGITRYPNRRRDDYDVRGLLTRDGYDRQRVATMLPKPKAAGGEREALANLSHALWRDAEGEGRMLRELLTEALEDVCSLHCRSYFPPGYVRSDADHHPRCHAIRAALAEPQPSPPLSPRDHKGEET